MKKITFFRRSVVLLWVAISGAPVAHALDQIIRPYQSARSAGMGNVRYTTGIYDENFFANPARVAANPKWRIDIINVTAETNDHAIKNAQKLLKGGDTIANAASTAGQNNHARVESVLPAFYFPRFFGKKSAVSFGVITSSQADIDLRRNLSIDPTIYVDVGPVLSYARRFFSDERLVVGATVHALYRVATKQSYSTVDYIRYNGFKLDQVAGKGGQVDGDIGATYKMPGKPKGWTLAPGGAVNNLFGGTNRQFSLAVVNQVTAKPPRQPRTFNAGISAEKKNIWFFNDVKFAFEMTDLGNNRNGSIYRLVHIGNEIELFNWLFLRTGINQGYLCGGFGIDIPLLKIDVATYGEELTLNAGGMQDRRYILRVAFAL